MAAAPQRPNLHELVDQLNPAQADAVRAVVLQLVITPTQTSPRARREIAFAAAGATEHGITTTTDRVLAEGFGRD